MTRQLPPVSDRDRIAAARLAAERLAERLRREHATWQTYYSSDGGVVSQDKRTS